MKIKGTALLGDTIATMKVGESGYVYILEAIIITIKGELFINLDAEVLPTNNFENEAGEIPVPSDILKIKRTSKDKEGYEINLEDQCVTFIPRVEPIDNLFPEFESWIGPYSVKTAKTNPEALLRTLSIESLKKVLKTYEENEDYKTMAIIKKIIEDKKNNTRGNISEGTEEIGTTVFLFKIYFGSYWIFNFSTFSSKMLECYVKNLLNKKFFSQEESTNLEKHFSEFLMYIN